MPQIFCKEIYSRRSPRNKTKELHHIQGVICIPPNKWRMRCLQPKCKECLWTRNPTLLMIKHSSHGWKRRKRHSLLVSLSQSLHRYSWIIIPIRREDLQVNLLLSDLQPFLKCPLTHPRLWNNSDCSREFS